jgi:hypothetical protein
MILITGSDGSIGVSQRSGDGYALGGGHMAVVSKGQRFELGRHISVAVLVLHGHALHELGCPL